MAKIKITQTGSPIRRDKTQRATLVGLGHFGAGRVTIRTAPAGTGIIAGGPMRAIFESLGVADVVTKSVGTSNPYNMIRATFDALAREDSPRSVAQRRNIKVSSLQSRRQGVEADAADS